MARFVFIQGKSDSGLPQAEMTIAGAEGRSRRAVVLCGTSGLCRDAPQPNGTGTKCSVGVRKARGYAEVLCAENVSQSCLGTLKTLSKHPELFNRKLLGRQLI